MLFILALSLFLCSSIAQDALTIPMGGAIPTTTITVADPLLENPRYFTDALILTDSDSLVETFVFPLILPIIAYPPPENPLIPPT
jgi:hypothetical protein